MKIFIPLALICLCLCYELEGQALADLERLSSSTTLLYGNNDSKAISKITGSPYLIDGFASTDMVIEVVGKEQNANFNARFNIYSNTFEVKYNEEIKYLDAAAVRTFEYTEGDKKFKFIQAVKFQEAGFEGKGFVELLSEGKAQLIAQEDISVKKVTKRGFGVPDEVSETFYREKSYFIFISDQFYDFKSFRNSSLEIFGDKADLVKDFVKSENLKFRNEEDIRKAVNHFNSL